MNFPWAADIVLHPVTKKLFPLVRDKEKFFNWCGMTFKEGDKVWMKVDKPSKSRTHEQFKYLYSCVYLFIAKEWGDCPLDVVDGVMKRRLLTVFPDTPMEYVKNKTDLNRAELAEFIDGCRREVAMLGIETQDPLK